MTQSSKKACFIADEELVNLCKIAFASSETIHPIVMLNKSKCAFLPGVSIVEKACSILEKVHLYFMKGLESGNNFNPLCVVSLSPEGNTAFFEDHLTEYLMDFYQMYKADYEPEPEQQNSNTHNFYVEVPISEEEYLMLQEQGNLIVQFFDAETSNNVCSAEPIIFSEEELGMLFSCFLSLYLDIQQILTAGETEFFTIFTTEEKKSTYSAFFDALNLPEENLTDDFLKEVSQILSASVSLQHEDLIAIYSKKLDFL